MMFDIGLTHYLVLSFVLFSIGLAGFVTRRNALIMMMAIELMLNGANVAFIAYSRYLMNDSGHVVVFFIMALAAAEAAVGIALVLGVFRHLKTVNLDEMRQLKG